MRRLFISSRALLLELRTGAASAADIGNALFFLDCTRGHVLAPWRDERTGRMCPHDERSFLFTDADGRPDLDMAAVVHRRAITELLAAEQQGRVQWIGIAGDGSDLVRTWPMLNQLLTRFGLLGVPTPADTGPTLSCGGNWHIRQAVQHACLDLLVAD